MTESAGTTNGLRWGSLGWYAVLAAVTLGGYAYVHRPVETDVAWRDDLVAAKAAAKDRGTALLVEFTSHGCGYCIKMDREVFARKDVAAAVNRFEPVKLYWSDAEEIGRRYGVEAFPTFVVMDEDGRPLLGTVGYMPPGEFKKFLQRASAIVWGGAGEAEADRSSAP